MELHTQIKKYRTSMNLSQEQLAEKIYVTRQSISNWENNKNYPDIHSLLLLSSLFDISLDQLIKGDIDTMKEEIKKSEIQKFNHYGTIFTVLLLVTMFSAVPLAMFLHVYGMIIFAALFAVTMYYALKVEACKKANNVQTYKEILSFTEGKRLDEIEQNQEIGKRPYQKVMLVFGSAAITLIVCLLLFLVLRPFLGQEVCKFIRFFMISLNYDTVLFLFCLFGGKIKRRSTKNDKSRAGNPENFLPYIMICVKSPLFELGKSKRFTKHICLVIMSGLLVFASILHIIQAC